MRKKIYYNLVLGLLTCTILVLSFDGYGQITVGETPLSFHTLNPKVDVNRNEGDMYGMNFTDLFDLSKANEAKKGGIVADNFGANGKVTMSVYIYNKDATDGKGNLIYECFSDHASLNDNDFVAQTTQKSVHLAIGGDQIIDKTDIVYLLASNNIYKTTCTKYVQEFTSSAQIAMSSIAFCALGCLVIAALGWWTFGVGGVICGLTCAAAALILGASGVLTEKYDAPHDYDCAMNYSPAQRIVVEVTAQNARIKTIKVPVIGAKSINDFGCGVTNFRVVVSINGALYDPITYPQSTASIPVYNATMGDEISISVQSDIMDGGILPEIHGVPKVWAAQFAGDMMYHCNPDVQPGEFNPFIGFDTRVHTLMVRKTPDDFYSNVPNWDLTLDGTKQSYSWSWTADRQMDATKTKYMPSLTWPKAHVTVTDNPTTGKRTYNLNTPKQVGTDPISNAPIYQRQCQKEGLNTQYLTYFKNGLASSYTTYDGSTKYMMGSDEDELVYLNSKMPQSSAVGSDGTPILNIPCNVQTDPNCQNANGIIKLEAQPWKLMPEGIDQTYNSVTGFPERGFPLNYAVDAYRRNRESNRNGKSPNPYTGYEIQDTGVDWDHPNGNGANNTNPGVITVSLGLCRTIQFKMNVKSPLDKENNNDLGFYQALVGEEAPSFSEKSVNYWLRGVENKTDAELSKYALTYTTMNRVGVTKDTSLSVKEIVLARRQQRSSWWQWLKNYKQTLSNFVFGTGKIKFDLEGPAYGWITAYYKRTPTSPRVAVAGKELTPISMAFMGIDTMKYNGANGVAIEGKGQRGQIFYEDFRSTQNGDFTIPRNLGASPSFVTKYIREYVVPVNTTLTFTAFDGDPWLFDNKEEEFYLSNRAMAKRVRNYLLDGSYTEGENGVKTPNNTPDKNKAYLVYSIEKLQSDGSEPLLFSEEGVYVDMPSDIVTGLTSATRKDKNLTCKFTTTGYYGIRASYRGGDYLYYRIRIVDYDGSNNNYATISTRALTPKEGGWLGISNTAGYVVYGIEDILTKEKYVDGFRAAPISTPNAYYSGPDLSAYANKPNRWSKFNDYADGYSWSKVTRYSANGAPIDDRESPILGSSQVRRYIERYDSTVRQQWFWRDWTLHFSSNWQGIKTPAGDQGLPPYVSDNKVTRIRQSEDVNSYNNYIKNSLFCSTDYAGQTKAPWQFILPFVAYTDYYGMRSRVNPKCIFDLEKLFNSTTGAFTGNPTIPRGVGDIRSPNYSDDYKDQQDFYQNLRWNRIIISSTPIGAQVGLRVYAVNPNNNQNGKLLAFTNASSSKREAAEEDDDAEMEVTVSPNPHPTEGSFLVKLSNAVSGNIHFELYGSITGIKIFTQDQRAEMSNSFTLNPKGLIPGEYVLKVNVNDRNFTKKVVIF